MTETLSHPDETNQTGDRAQSDIDRDFKEMTHRLAGDEAVVRPFGASILERSAMFLQPLGSYEMNRGGTVCAVLDSVSGGGKKLDYYQDDSY